MCLPMWWRCKHTDTVSKLRSVNKNLKSQESRGIEKIIDVS